jgi:hypothetical protein
MPFFSPFCGGYYIGWGLYFTADT